MRLLLSLVALFFINPIECRVYAGFVHVYDPSIGMPKKWYINDHTFIKDSNGTWHMFGITHEEPAKPLEERMFAHATAQHLLGSWTKHRWALVYDPKYHNERHLWAPHVIKHNGTYYMFYCGGGPDHTKYAISLATSKDLWTWSRLKSGPLFRDGHDARDPFVININGTWHMFYTANSNPKRGNHIVAVRTSHNLVNWSNRRTVFTDPQIGDIAGPTESPFIVQRNGWWYLFIGPFPGYVGTRVFRSKDPLNFTLKQQVGWIPAHAAEVINDNGTWWISHSGWGQGGLHLARLFWE